MKLLKQFWLKSRVLLLLCLVALLSSCTKTITKTDYLYPSQAYLTPCVRTAFNGNTYGDAIEHLIKVTGERDLCASQIDNIREWQVRTKAGFK